MHVENGMIVDYRNIQSSVKVAPLKIFLCCSSHYNYEICISLLGV